MDVDVTNIDLSELADAEPSEEIRPGSQQSYRLAKFWHDQIDSVAFYGFIYLWRDRRTKRYYLGSHMGTEHDGYICSSREMKAEYDRRPRDFKRRILYRIPVDNHKALLLIEGRWLRMIKPYELGRRYYNLTTIIRSIMLKGGTMSDAQREQMRQRSTGRKHTIVAIEKIVRANVGRKKVSKDPEGRRERQRLAHLGKRLTPETKAKMSAAHKGKNTWSKGRSRTAEVRAKIGAANRGKTIGPGYREKIRQSLIGKQFTEERCANISAGHARRRAARQGGIQVAFDFEVS